MEEATEHLYNREYNGKIIIDDSLKAAIDAYYRQYGVHWNRRRDTDERKDIQNHMSRVGSGSIALGIIAVVTVTVTEL